MLYIVNETKSNYKLAKENANNDIGTYLGITVNENFVPLIIVNDSEEIADTMIAKVEEVAGNRTTKAFLSVDNKVALYDTIDTVELNTVPRLIYHDNGLGPDGYKYPKSLVIVLTEPTDDDESSILEIVDENENRAKVVHHVYNENIGGIHVDIFSVDVTKWSKIAADYCIILPCGEKLKFSTIQRTNRNGDPININALIRCDLAGKEIVRDKKKKTDDAHNNKKKYNGNKSNASHAGNKNNYNFKNKKDKKRAFNNLVKSVR